jgi:hypothetical protein
MCVLLGRGWSRWTCCSFGPPLDTYVGCSLLVLWHILSKVSASSPMRNCTASSLYKNYSYYNLVVIMIIYSPCIFRYMEPKFFIKYWINNKLSPLRVCKTELTKEPDRISLRPWLTNLRHTGRFFLAHGIYPYPSVLVLHQPWSFMTLVGLGVGRGTSTGRVTVTRQA